jgi:thiol-disulfide isomerase/thioredoxin
MKWKLNTMITAYRWKILGATLVLILFSTRGVAAQELPLGSELPATDQVLQNVAGGEVVLSTITGQRGTAVVFWSNQCPWIDRYENRFLTLAQEFGGQGIRFVLVNSNDASAYPKETVEESRQYAADRNFSQAGVTYLADPNAQLARAFGAERTPHVFLFDANSRLVFVGAIDDSPGDPGNVQKTYFRDALDALSRGAAVPGPKTKAFGCTIKTSG